MTKPTGRPRGRPPKPKGPPAPPKPRGRPPGSKNKPNCLGAFIEEAFKQPPEPKLPPARKRHRIKGVWAHMTPEQRSEYARSLRAKRSQESLTQATSIPGKPSHLTIAEYEALVAQATPAARRIIKVMKKNGELSEMDRIAETAMAALLVMLKSQATVRDKTAIAKTLLEFTKSKPTTKSEVTVKSAEELLDEVANLVLEDDDQEDVPGG